MKRWAIGSIAFFAALLIGFLIADIWNQPGPALGAPDSNGIPAIVVKDQTFEKPNASADDFIAEFRDLPNFEDIKYIKPPGKLIELLDDGIYRRSEVVAKNGESWMVLLDNGGELSFYQRKANVRKLNSVSWPGEERDARLFFDHSGKPIIALKNIKAIEKGPVTTVFHLKRWAEYEDGSPDFVEISDGFRREYTLGNETYILRTSYGLTNDGTKAAVLLLESGDKIQILKQIYYVRPDRERPLTGERNIFGSLLWVGDMDSDGKLDLYFDEFNEKGFTYTELHLSSQATEGRLVGIAADFGMAGC